MIVSYTTATKKAAKLLWKQLLLYLVYASAICVFFLELKLRPFGISQTPLTIIGTVVSFLLGFRNNGAYDRWIEARRAWGALVGHGRSFGAQVVSMIQPKGLSTTAVTALHRDLLYRQLAYLNALRVQLRVQPIDGQLGDFLLPDEQERLRDIPSPSTLINAWQMTRLGELRRSEQIDEHRYLQLLTVLSTNFEAQGTCERIKATPFPLAYDSSARLIFWIFLLLLPFTLVKEFGYQATFFSFIIALIFMIVNEAGTIIQAPFENKDADVPMTALCRTLEIDYRRLLGEDTLPPSATPEHGVLM